MLFPKMATNTDICETCFITYSFYFQIKNKSANLWNKIKLKQ